jgi:hypothetical protein
MNKIRILNTSGLGYQTKVVDADTGEEIQNITKVEIFMAVDCAIEAVLHMFNVQVDVVAENSVRDVTTVQADRAVDETENSAALRLQLEKYRQEGIMPGFFTWLDELERPLETVKRFEMSSEPIYQGVVNGYKTCKQSDIYDISVRFQDGTTEYKTFQKDKVGTH